MRQIIFDTETTGMNFENTNKAEGHRVIEIGCVELIDRLPTGNHFHLYLNPERLVDPDAFRVHGISDDFLADKPVFADIIEQFEAYLDGADELIAHNIAFDRAFLDQELAMAGRNYQPRSAPGPARRCRHARPEAGARRRSAEPRSPRARAGQCP